MSVRRDHPAVMTGEHRAWVWMSCAAAVTVLGVFGLVSYNGVQHGDHNSRDDAARIMVCNSDPDPRGCLLALDAIGQCDDDTTFSDSDDRVACIQAVTQGRPIPEEEG